MGIQWETLISMGTHSVPWPLGVSTSFLHLHVMPSLTYPLLLYRHTLNLALTPTALLIEALFSSIHLWPQPHVLGYSHVLAPASPVLVLIVPGSSSSPLPRSLSVTSWCHYLLIFPVIHHFYHCLVNTLNPIDLCFPTALVAVHGCWVSYWVGLNFFLQKTVSSDLGGFSGGWLSGKELAFQCRRHKRHGFDPWVRKIPLEEEMATRSSILDRKIPWTNEPGGLQPLG